MILFVRQAHVKDSSVAVVVSKILSIFMCILVWQQALLQDSFVAVVVSKTLSIFHVHSCCATSTFAR